ncbi:type 11 methyltransferase [Perkinsela sp. CCAP 1560/4]|nr:type 11 methyltransferase [Perkinsela sp. CCAP 1560/4]|eukprot:KNH09673.1 type 11 methyltransferase [Perkinsela sp. CCAP 1560/4]
MHQEEQEIEKALEVAFDFTSDSHARKVVKRTLLHHLRRGFDAGKIARKIPRQTTKSVRGHLAVGQLRIPFNPFTESEAVKVSSWELLDYMHLLSAFSSVLFSSVHSTLLIEGLVQKQDNTPRNVMSESEVLECATMHLNSFSHGEPLILQKVLGSIHCFANITLFLLQYVTPSREVLLMISLWKQRFQVFINIADSYCEKLSLFPVSKAKQFRSRPLLNGPTLQVVQWNLTLLERSLFSLLLGNVAPCIGTVTGPSCSSRNRVRLSLSSTKIVLFHHDQEEIQQFVENTAHSKSFRKSAVPYVVDWPLLSPSQRLPYRLATEETSYFCNFECFTHPSVSNSIGSIIGGRINPSIFAGAQVRTTPFESKQFHCRWMPMHQKDETLMNRSRTHYDITLQSLVVQAIEQREQDSLSDLIVLYVRTYLHALENSSFDRVTQVHLISKLYVHLEMLLSSSQPRVCSAVFDVLLNIILGIHLQQKAMFPGAIHSIMGVSLNVLWLVFADDRKYEELWQNAIKFIFFVYPPGARLHPSLLEKMFEGSLDRFEASSFIIGRLWEHFELSPRCLKIKRRERVNLSLAPAFSMQREYLEALGGANFLQILYMESNSSEQRITAFSILFCGIIDSFIRSEISELKLSLPQRMEHMSFLQRVASRLLPLLIEARFHDYGIFLLKHFPDHATKFVRDFCYRRIGYRLLSYMPLLSEFIKGIAKCSPNRHSAFEAFRKANVVPIGQESDLQHIASLVLYLINSDRVDLRALGVEIFGRFISHLAKWSLKAADCVVNITPPKNEAKSFITIFDDGTISTMNLDSFADLFVDFIDPFTECISTVHAIMLSICSSAHSHVRVVFFEILQRLILCIKAESKQQEMIIALLNLNLSYYFQLHPTEKAGKIIFSTFEILMHEIGYSTSPVITAKQNVDFPSVFYHPLRASENHIDGLAESFCAGQYLVNHGLLVRLNLSVLFNLLRIFSTHIQEFMQDDSFELDHLQDLEIRRFVLLSLVFHHPESRNSVEMSVWLTLMDDNNPVIALTAARIFLLVFQERHHQLFTAWENIFHFQPEFYSNGLFGFLYCLSLLIQFKEPKCDGGDDAQIRCQQPLRDIHLTDSRAFGKLVCVLVKVYYLKGMYASKILNRI